MDKILALLKKLGIELTADQTEQVREVLGKEFLEELKSKETDVFAKEQQGLFMGSTHSEVPENCNNTAAQISAAFGLHRR